MLRSMALASSLGFLASPSQAARLVVQDPCSSKLWLDVEAHGQVGDSIGKVTIATLKAQKVHHTGSERGIQAIGMTVTGDDAFELISDREMRAYGWCYEVNGRVPELYADQLTMLSADDEIRWFFGFAHYVAGEWVSSCTPTHLTRPDFICGEP